MKIGIVGAEEEVHSNHMKNLILEKGIDVCLIDTLKYPDEATLSLFEETTFYNEICIDDMKSFYVRSVFYSHPPYDLEEAYKNKLIDWDGWYTDYVSERERQSQLASWLRSLSLKGRTIVNPIESFDLHYLKPYQLSLLRNNGIPVPKTLVTNNPNHLREFKDNVKTIVYKPVAGGAGCKLLEDADWSKERLSLLHNAPVLFQEYIEGENIRVFVLAGKVISSAIIYTKEIDYRGHEESIEKIELPRRIKKMCIKAATLCGMVFSGIDLKRKSSEEYVLLECNPSPMFLGFQSATGDLIDEALATYLIKKASE